MDSTVASAAAGGRGLLAGFASYLIGPGNPVRPKLQLKVSAILAVREQRRLRCATRNAVNHSG
jgi:hypothetical protein